MTQIALSKADLSAFERALANCRAWASEHQAEIGALEMALGAGILSWGVMSDQVNLGRDVLASKLGDIGGVAGAGIGALASTAVAEVFLKGLFVGGVATVAGTTCVPAVAIIGGATLVMGAFGYVVGDKLGGLLNPTAGFSDLLGAGSIVAVGVALMIDGARRIIKDERMLAALSSFKDGVIHLVEPATEVVASSIEELQKLVKEIGKSTAGMSMAAGGAAGGAMIGSSLAASSVTVLGSKGLGALALSMGLVSAPVWPVIAGGAAGLAAGTAAWKGIKYLRGKRHGRRGSLDVQLLQATSIPKLEHKK